jgi:hypothetical protein
MNTIVSLNGDWEILWDTEDMGITNRWYATYPTGRDNVQVPHIWERSVANKTSSMDTAYYFKKFRLDEKNAAKRIFLQFSRVATHATVWLNGKILGDHFGSYTSFVFEATKHYKQNEENILCVRVANMGASNSRIDFGKNSGDDTDDRYIYPAEAPMGLPWTQYPFGGIIGDVSLIVGNAAFISGIQLEPDPDQNRISVEATFNNPRGYQATLRLLMRNPSGEVAEIQKAIKLEKENATQRFSLKLKKDAQIWTPEKPYVYAVELQLISNKLKKNEAEPNCSFSIMKPFGFRKFDCINGDFYLNDSILKIQAVNYSQHWSNGGLWTLDNDAMEKDLKAVKDAGFNAIRSGGAPLPEAALNICDKIGLLVFQELPIHTMRSSKRGLDMVNELIKDSVLEQKHHPCIAAWILGAENGTMMLENGTKLLKEVDQYDISHPIISNLNCVYLDNEEQMKCDTGKLMGITNDRTILYSSHRMHLRMNPSANLSDFLIHYCNKEVLDEISVPDSTLGDSSFQDEYESFVKKVSGKVLVTLKNHTLLPNTPTKLEGPRSQKNAKAIKALFKSLDQFISDKELSIWKNTESFRSDLFRLATKSKYDQITALQSNPLVSGYILDQWADYGTDFCGLYDENRKRKDLKEFMQKITKPTRLLVSALEHTIVAGGEISMQLALLNQRRLKAVSVTLQVINEAGKTEVEEVLQLEGHTSLTAFGSFSIQAPKTPGNYELLCTLKADNETIDVVSEKLSLILASDTQSVMSKVCFLDNCEGTSDVLRALRGSEPLIFTANLSSWNDEIISQIVNVTKNEGKTLLLSDMTLEDIEFFNTSHHFEQKLESHFTTGAQEMSLHYLPENSPLKDVLKESVLSEMSAAVMPSVSLNALEGSDILARSVSFANGEIKTGVDLQILPFGKGKIIFNQFNVFEGLETNALADALFCKIVNLA